jgi:hypothetical protein
MTLFLVNRHPDTVESGERTAVLQEVQGLDQARCRGAVWGGLDRNDGRSGFEAWLSTQQICLAKQRFGSQLFRSDCRGEEWSRCINSDRVQARMTSYPLSLYTRPSLLRSSLTSTGLVFVIQYLAEYTPSRSSIPDISPLCGISPPCARRVVSP